MLSKPRIWKRRAYDGHTAWPNDWCSICADAQHRKSKTVQTEAIPKERRLSTGCSELSRRDDTGKLPGIMPTVQTPMEVLSESYRHTQPKLHIVI